MQVRYSDSFYDRLFTDGHYTAVDPNAHPSPSFSPSPNFRPSHSHNPNLDPNLDPNPDPTPTYTFTPTLTLTRHYTAVGCTVPEWVAKMAQLHASQPHAPPTHWSGL